MLTTPHMVSLYESTYGALYFAAVLSTGFYGVACMQTFFYYVHYQNDSLRKKIFVAIMWALNTIHEALVVSGAFKFIMAGLVNPSSYETENPEFVILYILTALVAVPTQGYFACRIYLFSEKRIAVLVIWVVLGLVQLACTMACVGRALYSGDGNVHAVMLSVLDSSSSVILATLCFAVAGGVDVLIAVFMTFLLVRERTSTSFARTSHLLQRLIVFAVNTGTWTATFALLSIISLYVFPSNSIYTVFAFPLCSVYCNTLLANLNARAYFKDGAGHNVNMDFFGASPNGLPVADNTESDERRAETNLVTAPRQGAGVRGARVMFQAANRSANMEIA